MQSNLLDTFEFTGASMVAQRVREQARENILARMEATEAATIAADLIAQIDAQVAQLRGQLPGLAERERPATAKTRELQELVIELNAQRARPELDNDKSAATFAGNEIRKLERQIHEHQSELRTVVNRRADITHRLGNLEQARRELAALVV